MQNRRGSYVYLLSKTNNNQYLKSITFDVFIKHVVKPFPAEELQLWIVLRVPFMDLFEAQAGQFINLQF